MLRWGFHQSLILERLTGGSFHRGRRRRFVTCLLGLIGKLGDGDSDQSYEENALDSTYATLITKELLQHDVYLLQG